MVIAKSIDQTLKRTIQEALLTMHEDPRAANALRYGAIERFVQACDEDYQDIREMRNRSQHGDPCGRHYSTTSSARFRVS